MRFSTLTERVKGGAADAWDQHYLAKQASARGEDVIILSVGDPDFATPQGIIDRASLAMREVNSLAMLVSITAASSLACFMCEIFSHSARPA